MIDSRGAEDGKKPGPRMLPRTDGADSLPPQQASGLGSSAVHDPDELICSKHGTRADKIVRSQATNTYIHAAITYSDARTGDTICGAPVVRRGSLWMAAILPGRIVKCFPNVMSTTLHEVRLGRLHHNGSGSWTGTALCGARPGELWLPASPPALVTAKRCQACDAIRSRSRE